MQKTVDLFKLLAPDVADSMTDSEIETVIGLAQDRISYDVWGDRYRQGLVYLAAHVKQLADRGGKGAGPITSEKAGKVSRSYGFSSNSNADGLGSTEYGKQFVELRKELPGTKPLTAYGNYDG